MKLERQSCESNRRVMNQRAVLALLHGMLLASLPITFSLPTSDGEASGGREITYEVSTKLEEDVKESEIVVTMKCRQRTEKTLACDLSNAKHRTKYIETPCGVSNPCDSAVNGDVDFTADNSYDGNFDIRLLGSKVNNLLFSSDTTQEQLNFYRKIADLLTLGNGARRQNDGDFGMIGKSVYGECLDRIHIAHENQTFVVERRTRLRTCDNAPRLLTSVAFFHRPTMGSVNYDINSSYSECRGTNDSMTCHMIEEMAVRSLEGDGETTALRVRTNLTQLTPVT